LSSDPEQEFFSDGITEEITAALAKIPDLRVVARTSSFQFKAENRDVQGIGQKLHATHYIEGSVRKAGNRIRITAQLIEAGNGVHMWAENYDRELTDVFAIQEDIATAIAGALRMPLGLKQGQRLISNRSINPESYQQYLHAKALIRTRRGLKPLTDAAALLEQVVADNADYAPAWAALGQAYGYAPYYNPAARYGPFEEWGRFIGVSFSKAEAAARRAIQLDPNLADGYLPLGMVQAGHGPILATEELYSKALALDPNNPEALELYGYLLGGVGRLQESIAMFQRLQELEPFVPAFNANGAVIRWQAGQTDAAIAVLKQIQSAATARELVRIYAAMGR
jgi:TolB-like protein